MVFGALSSAICGRHVELMNRCQWPTFKEIVSLVRLWQYRRHGCRSEQDVMTVFGGNMRIEWRERTGCLRPRRHVYSQGGDGVIWGNESIENI